MPPAASPRPPPPSPRACLNKCHGATCGSFLPYTCAAFELQGCDCSGCCGSDTDLRCATEPWAALGLENTYPFTEGYSGRSIEDGGSDMYDGGNYISVVGKTAEGKARWMGVDEMLLLVQKGNKAALNLYSKLGYEAMPRTSDHGNQVCLKKHLYLNPHSLRSMAPQVTWVKAL